MHSKGKSTWNSSIGCGVSFELSCWACFHGRAKTYAGWLWHSSYIGELWYLFLGHFSHINSTGIGNFWGFLKFGLGFFWISPKFLALTFKNIFSTAELEKKNNDSEELKLIYWRGNFSVLLPQANRVIDSPSIAFLDRKYYQIELANFRVFRENLEFFSKCPKKPG